MCFKADPSIDPSSFRGLNTMLTHVSYLSEFALNAGRKRARADDSVVQGLPWNDQVAGRNAQTLLHQWPNLGSFRHRIGDH